MRSPPAPPLAGRPGRLDRACRLWQLGQQGRRLADDRRQRALLAHAAARGVDRARGGARLRRGERLGVIRRSQAVQAGAFAGWTTHSRPARAARNVRTAVKDGALAIVDEGTGVDASWRIANSASVPIGIAYQGGIKPRRPDKRPNVFRIAPTDRGIAFRLAEYHDPERAEAGAARRRLGLRPGREQGHWGRRRAAPARRSRRASTLPSSALDVSPQVLRAKRAGATALLVWAQPATIAATLTAARTAGWKVPVYTPPAGESPLIRQQLADHPDWVDG